MKQVKITIAIPEFLSHLQVFNGYVVPYNVYVDNYDPTCSAKAWLRQAAFFAVQHLNRNEKRQIQTPAISEIVKKYGYKENYDETLESELFDYLQRNQTKHFFNDKLNAEEILSVVNEEDRKILRFKYVFGYSTKEIAANLGISEGAADVRLSRAKKRLRKGYLEQ